MTLEKSCGSVIFRRAENGFLVLLVRHKNGGHWAFPKGHVEGEETEHQTAVREVREETGLSIVINTDFREMIRYSPKKGVLKDVVYFLSVVNESATKRQEEEIAEIRWADFKEATSLVTFEGDHGVLCKAIAYAEKYLK